MKDERTYELNFSGLKLGEHEFQWNVDTTLFEKREVESFKQVNLDAILHLNKKERMLLLDFDIKGTLGTSCDRCGEDLSIDLNLSNELVVKLSDKTDLTDDEVVFLDDSEHSIDLEQFIYEFIVVGLPSRLIHQEGECNPDVERYLEEKLEEETEEKRVDPRWEALKNIKTND